MIRKSSLIWTGILGIGLVAFALTRFHSDHRRAIPPPPERSNTTDAVAITPTHPRSAIQVHAPTPDPTPELPTAAPKLTPAIAAIEQHYPTGEARVAAIIDALRKTGAAPQPLAAQGDAMRHALAAANVVGPDWECFEGGCYFRVTRETTPDEIVAIRERSAPGHVLALTADPIPNKLIVLINDSEEPHEADQNSTM